MARSQKPAPGQLGLFDRLGGLARHVEVQDPRRPADLLFCVVLALVTFGLLIQTSHAATTLEPEAFRQLLLSQTGYRFPALMRVLALSDSFRTTSEPRSLASAAGEEQEAS